MFVRLKGNLHLFMCERTYVCAFKWKGRGCVWAWMLIRMFESDKQLSNEIRRHFRVSVMCLSVICMCAFVCVRACIHAPICCMIMWPCRATWYSMQFVSYLSSTGTCIATWQKVWGAACRWDKYSCSLKFFLHREPNHHLVFSFAFFHSLQPYFPHEQVLNWSFAASWTCVWRRKWEEEHRKESSGRFSLPSIKLVVLLLISRWELNKNAHQNLKASAQREDDFHLWSSINGSVNRGGGCM